MVRACEDEFLEGKAVRCWWAHQAARNEGLNLLFFYGFLFFLIVCWWNLVSTLLPCYKKLLIYLVHPGQPYFVPLVYQGETALQRENHEALSKRSSFSSYALAERTLQISFYPAIKLVRSPLAFLPSKETRSLALFISCGKDTQHRRALVLNYRICYAIRQMDIIWNSSLPPSLMLQNSWQLSLPPGFPVLLNVCLKEGSASTKRWQHTGPPKWLRHVDFVLEQTEVFILVPQPAGCPVRGRREPAEAGQVGVAAMPLKHNRAWRWCREGLRAWEATVPLLGRRNTFKESIRDFLQCLHFIWMFPLASVSHSCRSGWREPVWPQLTGLRVAFATCLGSTVRAATRFVEQY